MPVAVASQARPTKRMVKFGANDTSIEPTQNRLMANRNSCRIVKRRERNADRGITTPKQRVYTVVNHWASVTGTENAAMMLESEVLVAVWARPPHIAPKSMTQNAATVRAVLIPENGVLDGCCCPDGSCDDSVMVTIVVKPIRLREARNSMLSEEGAGFCPTHHAVGHPIMTGHVL